MACDLRIVLLGKTGSGKSATGNTILDRKAFEVADFIKSTNKLCEKKEGTVGDKNVSIIDTPGLFNTTIKKQQLKAEIQKCVEMSSPGPHVFLLVIKLGVRFTKEERDTVKWIQENFGKEALCRTIILFTHADQLMGKPVEDFINKSKYLMEIVNNFGGRYHSFNNEDRNHEDQVTELLKKINSVIQENEMNHYTLKMFKSNQKSKKVKIACAIAMLGIGFLGTVKIAGKIAAAITGRAAGEAVEKAAVAAGEGAVSAVEAVQSLVEKTADTAGEAVQAVAEKVADTAGEAVQTVAEKVADTAGEAVQTVAEKVADTAGEAVQAVAEKVADTAGEAVQTVAEKVADTAGEAVQAVAEKVADTAGEAVQAVAEKVADTAGEAVQPVAEKVVDTAGEAVQAVAEKVADTAGEAVQAVAEKVVDTAGEAVETVATKAGVATGTVSLAVAAVAAAAARYAAIAGKLASGRVSAITALAAVVAGGAAAALSVAKP